MISTVLCGRFYKVFVSPMLHKNPSQNGLRGIFRISAGPLQFFGPGPAFSAFYEGPLRIFGPGPAVE